MLNIDLMKRKISGVTCKIEIESVPSNLIEKEKKIRGIKTKTEYFIHPQKTSNSKHLIHVMHKQNKRFQSF